MAVGKYPFFGDRQKIKRLVTDSDPIIPEQYKDKPLGNLIMKLLQKSPEDRIRISELKLDPWVTNNGTEPVKSLAELGVDN